MTAKGTKKCLWGLCVSWADCFLWKKKDKQNKKQQKDKKEWWREKGMKDKGKILKQKPKPISEKKDH